ncbi:hypothetical protein D3C80_1202660 [compost metagenome]
MDDQLEARSLQRIQNALLHVDDIGGTGLVVDHADEEGSAEGQASRLRVGYEAQLIDGRLHPLACVFAHEGRLVDDAGNRLLGDLRHAGDVVDGGSLARFGCSRIVFRQQRSPSCSCLTLGIAPLGFGRHGLFSRRIDTGFLTRPLSGVFQWGVI